MSHIVICPICSKKFDRDKEPTTRYNAKRYAHADCFPQGEPVESTISQDEREIQEIKDYAKSVLGDSYNSRLVSKQIKKFHEEDKYSYSSILKVLQYYYINKHGDPTKALGGIGIVPFIFPEAKNYYYSLFLAQQVNEDKDIVQITTNNTREVKIKIPKPKLRKPKLFSLDFEKEENEDEE